MIQVNVLALASLLLWVSVYGQSTNVVDIAAGGQHSLALGSNGTVWAWGDNSLGQLGNGTNGNSSNLPAPVLGLTNKIAIAATPAQNIHPNSL